MKVRKKTAYTVGKRELRRKYETADRLYHVLDRNRDPAFTFSAGDLLCSAPDCISADRGLLSFLRIDKGEIMKIRRTAGLFLFLLCFLLLAGSVSKADEGGYTITDYDVKAILHPDNTIDVTERIGGAFYRGASWDLSEHPSGNDRSQRLFQKTGQKRGEDLPLRK